jgi:adenylate cyclase class IV
MQSYEVEVKSLLGGAEVAEALRARMKEIDSTTHLTSSNKQLNHYFVGGDIKHLAATVATHLSDEAKARLDDLAARAKEFSIRTREKDGTVLFVVKASVGDDTSANGVARMEFEEKMPLSLDELDELVSSAGFTYQAKWSREREEYVCKGITICLDHNAGYGWLAEFEQVVGSADEVAPARAAIAALMEACGVFELPQARLERMFAFYNAHWPEYYGTEKIFTVE